MLIYDGDCAFCTSSAAWIARRWPLDRSPAAVPWQILTAEAVAEIHLREADFNRAVWWVDTSRTEEGAQAVARALIAGGGVWAAIGRTLLVPPISWISAVGYRFVARFRHRLPGGAPTCRT